MLPMKKDTEITYILSSAKGDFLLSQDKGPRDGTMSAASLAHREITNRHNADSSLNLEKLKHAWQEYYRQTDSRVLLDSTEKKHVSQLFCRCYIALNDLDNNPLNLANFILFFFENASNWQAEPLFIPFLGFMLLEASKHLILQAGFHKLTPKQLGAMCETINNLEAGWTNILSSGWQFHNPLSLLDGIKRQIVFEAINSKQDNWQKIMLYPDHMLEVLATLTQQQRNELYIVIEPKLDGLVGGIFSLDQLVDLLNYLGDEQCQAVCDAISQSKRWSQIMGGGFNSSVLEKLTGRRFQMVCDAISRSCNWKMLIKSRGELRMVLQALPEARCQIVCDAVIRSECWTTIIERGADLHLLLKNLPETHCRMVCDAMSGSNWTTIIERGEDLRLLLKDLPETHCRMVCDAISGLTSWPTILRDVEQFTAALSSLEALRQDIVLSAISYIPANWATIINDGDKLLTLLQTIPENHCRTVCDAIGGNLLTMLAEGQLDRIFSTLEAEKQKIVCTTLDNNCDQQAMVDTIGCSNLLMYVMRHLSEERCQAVCQSIFNLENWPKLIMDGGSLGYTLMQLPESHCQIVCNAMLTSEKWPQFISHGYELRKILGSLDAGKKEIVFKVINQRSDNWSKIIDSAESLKAVMACFNKDQCDTICKALDDQNPVKYRGFVKSIYQENGGGFFAAPMIFGVTSPATSTDYYKMLKMRAEHNVDGASAKTLNMLKR